MKQILAIKHIGYSRNCTHLRIYFICFIFAVIYLRCKEANVVTFTTYYYDYYSNILRRNVEYSVVIPSNYKEKKAAGHRYPVLYLLHCAGCDNRSFIENYHLTESIDNFDILVVMPYDGTGGGWWLDSPIDTLSRLSTWLTGEFKNHIDSAFSTYTNRSNTGIAGHSMGGFGALYNLAMHPDIFGAAFSAKGLFDIIGHRGKYMAGNVLGQFNEYRQNYHNVDLLENVKWFVNINAPIKFYSGPNDWFQEENQRFDSLLTMNNVPHTYFENSEEDHYPMSRESMNDMLEWFDSLFTRD
ncbi:MAG: alpha/beta hydrolase-fold protein [Chitinispirillia bacterium]|jgi:S-formylglutathione hydrolase FrmB